MTDLKKITENLNPTQREAVESLSGPLLILAGAGSGKTRVLTHRIVNLVAQGEATVDQILAVTFTNKAAKEMEARALNLLQEMGIPVYDRLWISTFHSSCVRILREDIHLLGYQPFFTIYDDSDQKSVLKKVLNRLNINEKNHPVKGFQARINEAKQLGLTPQSISKRPHGLMDSKSLEVYTQYEEELKRANALDFGDLLLKTHELFENYPSVLEKYQNRFQYISVDEYQDTNHIQYLIVKKLASKHHNLCVVGDEDQSIYSWRGADITNILEFERDFPECKVVKLEQNYRSTKTIVEAASHLIKNNTQRKDKTLFTENVSGEKIHIHEDLNEYEEARFVVNNIKKHLETDPRSPNDFAIFYRTNAQSRVLEDLLRSNSIAYKIVGGVKFYERMEIKDVLAYLKVLINPTDDVAIKRIINTPARGIGKTTVEKIENYGISHNISFFDALLKVAEERLVHSGAAKKLRQFHIMLSFLMEGMKNAKPLEIFLDVLDQTGYVLRLKEENTTESQSRIDNLEELSNALRQFEQERGEEATLTGFLEEVALVSDIDQTDLDQPSVTMMTLHISKGLEYPVVFMVGLEEGLFPSARTFESGDPEGLEEERRLAYVGMTRAREVLYMSYARTRRVWGQEQSHPPSRFLNEIPEQYVIRNSAVSRPSSSFIDRYGQSASSGYSESSDIRPNTSGTPRFKQKVDPFPDYENESHDMSAKSYQKGMRVRHPTFGVGAVHQVEGSGDTQKVSVIFQDHSFRKFVAKYARLELV
ncbi:MAG: UvrD-helicase domain-containing protein [Bdellovibrionales bacterium]|nr:UvrD-helicase domain-containing protein [Bdellovibrionales bacterium]